MTLAETQQFCQGGNTFFYHADKHQNKHVSGGGSRFNSGCNIDRIREVVVHEYANFINSNNLSLKPAPSFYYDFNKQVGEKKDEKGVALEYNGLSGSHVYPVNLANSEATKPFEKMKAVHKTLANNYAKIPDKHDLTHHGHLKTETPLPPEKIERIYKYITEKSDSLDGTDTQNVSSRKGNEHEFDKRIKHNHHKPKK